MQIAWVTRDLAASEDVLTGLLGARKWVQLTGMHFAPDACTFRDQPADFFVDVSLSYVGDMQLELIMPTQGESIYTEFLATNGPGLHHICIETESEEAFAAAVTAAAERGAPAVQKGLVSGISFAYVSAPQSGVPYIEIVHLSADIRAFFEHVKKEQG
jgi:catechol 2,3-dioxygenase-like lactoylglutathione lyase family enzyme